MARYGEGIPIPDVIDPPESMRVTLCIPKNRDHSAAFFGALYQLTIWSSWQENGTTDGRDLAAVWWRYYLSWDRAMSDLDCEDGMNYCCVEAPQLKRIDPVTGGMEISVDGGATWTPDPASPKFAIVKPPPPVTSGVVAAKCDAAANAKQGIMSIVNTTSSDIATASTIFELATLVAAALLNVFLVVVTGGLASPLVLTVTGAIWGAMTAVWEMGQVAFDAYWNEEVFDALLCALYDNIGEDGSFNDAQYTGFRTQFNFNSPSSPARDMVMTAIGVGGAEGLSVMASYGGAIGSDCSDCLPPNCTNSFEVFCGAGIILEATEEYIRMQATANSLTGGYGIALTTGDPEMCCFVTDVTTDAGVSFSPLSAYRACNEPLPECGEAFGHANVYCFSTHTFTLYGLTDGEIIKIYLSDEPCPP